MTNTATLCLQIVCKNHHCRHTNKLSLLGLSPLKAPIERKESKSAIGGRFGFTQFERMCKVAAVYNVAFLV